MDYTKAEKRLKAERDALQAEVERLQVALESQRSWLTAALNGTRPTVKITREALVLRLSALTESLQKEKPADEATSREARSMGDD